MMRMQIVLVVLLVCEALCSADIEQDKRAIEEELLSSLLTSKMKQSQHGDPAWPLTLLNLCRLLNSPDEARWQGWQREDEEEVYGERLLAASEVLQEFANLQTFCRVLRPRELHESQDYFDLDQNSESPLKRKSPYILKRQLLTNKQARRPYILKRSTFY
ncbi:neurotensin/neuromedin N isoform X1 [Denticeps clupeoides]|uniref:neurotensin/neuromedin N isoform X1 n=1 Tax=Denticeps clupeoides TaxID=299321 RepID=UPI0010A52D81|nr:neurotensin/neuromedin N isoform X1 [Denticeps clupeoides]